MEIDASLAAAISATPANNPQGWFAAVCDTHDEFSAAGEEPSLSVFTEALAGRMPAYGIAPAAVAQFAEHLEATVADPMATIAEMRAMGDGLTAAYVQLAQGGLDGADGSGRVDDATWQAFLVEHGSRWDGQEASWDEFKQWFLYEADQVGVVVQANGFVSYADSRPDKPAMFAEYGVTLAGAAAESAQPVDVSGFPDVREGDSGEWVKYLDDMLKSSGF